MPRAPISRRVLPVVDRFSVWLRPALALILFLFPAAWLDASYTESAIQNPSMKNEFQHFDDVQRYIALGWDHLTRSLDRCKTYEDQKVGDEPYLYFPADFQSLPAFQELVKGCRVRVERLPEIISNPNDVHLNKISKAGLLYLPHAYVVPGGQFNEMYGWDSYFIILGLLRANRLDLARGRVKSFFYEIEHYCSVVKSNL